MLLWNRGYFGHVRLAAVRNTARFLPHTEAYEHLGTVETWIQDMHPVWESKRETLQLKIEPDGELMRLEIVQGPPPQEQQSLPYMEAHKVDPSTGEDEMAYADAPLAPVFAGNGTAAARADC